MVPRLSGARATIRIFLFCVLEKKEVSGVSPCSTIKQQSFGGDAQVRMKYRRDNTGPESTRESASTRASAKRDARLSVQETLTDKEPHENASCTNCVLTW